LFPSFGGGLIATIAHGHCTWLVAIELSGHLLHLDGGRLAPLQFIPQHDDVGRGLDTQLDSIAVHANDRHDNRITHSDAFSFPP
jgi:hypothetical protein